jgi:5-methyltetrahydrofolate--homocysteine methyltransferase
MDLKHIPRVSSALKAVDLLQQPPPLIIGERLNTQGSKRAKRLVLSDDFDGLIDLGREQVGDGAHCIDVCVATTERSDELEFMKKLVKRLSLEIDAPLVIDSTDPKVITEAIYQIPGRPIINSINLEGDGSRFHSLAPIMAKFGIPSISMCIGPNGMAKSSDDKIKVAKLLFETGKKYGLEPWQYIFDVLTFTLATGEQEYANSAVETLKGISLVKKEIKGCFTTLGLSNISFGLPPGARKIINSVFLHHALKSGLDTVIINARDIIPIGEINEEQVKLAEDLIFNRHSNALSELIYYFEKKNVQTTKNIQKLEINKEWDFDKRCYYRIVNRIKDGIEDDVVGSISSKLEKKLKIIPHNPEKKTILKLHPELSHEAAVETLNEVLLPAMKEVGDKFGSGELILPFVLKSAECMKSAVLELEKYLIKKQGVSKGKLVLCTVYGDVHDIGKNLVKTILSNNGYTVYDLGKQVPIEQIIDKIKAVQADAVGLSALLVSTSKQMQYFVEKAKELNIRIPTLCGGAAINSDYINRIAKGDEVYKAGVFYCKTAFDGLNVMNKLSSSERERFIDDWNNKITKLEDKKTIEIKRDIDIITKKIKPVSPPSAPHIDAPIYLTPSEINLNEVWQYLNKKSLFVLSWGIRGKDASKMISDPEVLLSDWKKKVIDECLFSPAVVYSYFKCYNQGNKLVVLSERQGNVVFEFPRSTKSKRLCITDYFGYQDIVAFQVVSVGQKLVSKIEELNSNNDYTDAYYLHGLGVETAEALAEWTHNKIRKELKLDINRGLRYSWGYPSCPDTMQHYLVWKLINPANCDINLTSAGQITPEYSTAAIVVHHPDAEYFIL